MLRSARGFRRIAIPVHLYPRALPQTLVDGSPVPCVGSVNVILGRPAGEISSLTDER